MSTLSVQSRIFFLTAAIAYITRRDDDNSVSFTIQERSVLPKEHHTLAHLVAAVTRDARSPVLALVGPVRDDMENVKYMLAVRNSGASEDNRINFTDYVTEFIRLAKTCAAQKNDSSGYSKDLAQHLYASCYRKLRARARGLSKVFETRIEGGRERL
ncbi:hypothetical protein AAF712_004966 [Marasmius tenuissimus]|uniref:Uncharacterized protein n=1 Tax=Marasmius tenuissimus TaxID=585030 RepID=A0ABR3A3V2_9AGAR